MSTTPTLAIDFGTSRTKVAYFDDNKQEPRLVELGHAVHTMMPSIFYVPKDGGKIVVGDDAEVMIDDDPGGIVVALKKEIHKAGNKRLGDGRKIERIKLASHLFRHIKEFTESNVPAFINQAVDSCVLTVPVCFSSPQRDAIRRAAELGGFQEVQIIEEPVAAARAWLAETHTQGIDSVIVCDIGGGTTDFAAVRLNRGMFLPIPEIATGGFTEGGDDVDESIISTLKQEDTDTSKKRLSLWSAITDIRAAFKSKVRNVKEKLLLLKKEQYDVRVKDAKLEIPQQTINRCIHTFTDKVCDELNAYLKTCRSKLNDEAIPILLVGGSSRLPELEEKIKRIAGKSPVHRWENADYAIVLGAALGERSQIIEPPPPPTLTPEEVSQRAFECYEAQNYGEAVSLFRNAAEQGDVRAQFNLGVCYSKGDGVREDKQEAVKWYRKAAEQDNAVAMYNMGICYASRTGVAKNFYEARHWIERAAKAGVPEAVEWLRTNKNGDSASGAVIGGILGGIVGFFIGGPVGALAGAGVGVHQSYTTFGRQNSNQTDKDKERPEDGKHGRCPKCDLCYGWNGWSCRSCRHGL